MSTLETRYGTTSPRTDELPRAFTFGEFARGAACAWLWFQPIGVFLGGIGFGIGEGETGFGIIATVFGVPVSFAATVAGSPLAFLLGLRLRRRRRDLTHVTAFALYGGAWGYLVQWLIFGHPTEPAAVAIAYTLATSAAVVLGWWTTSRLALRRDRIGRDE
ncbi:hypothetical protein [Gryllotalpicola koreensis]|uniref:Uncharacterized protein n=1 Tax=Gryllotalpicola koreensis TaxID=993086 RepID=A0ABP7ZX00_9MICO